VDKPTLVISHNKTLAAQLYAEFKSFFPNNAVEYFVSYFDYYQPEAYIPRTDTFIEKDSSRNEEIERMRLSTMSSLFSRRDVVVVASVSCIYGIGSKEDYEAMVIPIRVGTEISRERFLARLVDLQYDRNDIAFERGNFRVRGDTVEVYPPDARTRCGWNFSVKKSNGSRASSRSPETRLNCSMPSQYFRRNNS